MQITAVALMCIGLEHFWVSSTPPPEYETPIGGYLRGIPSTALTKLPNEADADYLARINAVVHQATHHCLPTDSRLSLIERWMFQSISDSASQGLLVKDRAYCGFCHQRSYLLSALLRSNGMDAIVLGLTGHVVVQAVVNGQSYIADPDFGVDPFPYSSDPTVLAATVQSRYVASPIAADIAQMFTSYKNNVPYYNTERLDMFEEQQRVQLGRAQMIATLLLVIAALTLFWSAAMGRLKAPS